VTYPPPRRVAPRRGEAAASSPVPVRAAWDDIDQSLVVDALRHGLHVYSSRLGSHSTRVGALAHLLGLEIDLDASVLRLCAHAGTVHDIGKLGVPHSVLHKPAALTPAERAAVERHPAIGAATLQALSPHLGPLAEAVLAHHEHVDGSGYPRGLRGPEIPPLARLVGIVDVYDALTHKRAYRDYAYSAARARDTVLELSGSYFDPEYVAAALPVLQAHARARRAFALPGRNIATPASIDRR